MRKPACRALFLSCLLPASLWAAGGPTEVNTGRTNTGTGVNTGLPSGGSVTGNNMELGSGSLTPTLQTGGSVKTVVAPTVDSNKNVGLTPVAPGGVVTPQELPTAPVYQQTPGRSNVSKPQATVPGNPVIPAAAAPQADKNVVPTGFTGISERMPSKDGNPAAVKTLDNAVKGIQLGVAAAAQGMGEFSVRQALDHIFDTSRVNAGQANLGVANITGGAMVSSEEKIKKTVSIANTSGPKDAPDLYASAIKTAEDSFPAQVAGLVKQAVLGYASQKAVTALPDLANQAYQSAAAGVRTEVQKAFTALDKWEKLLGSPGQPLVANAERLKTDIERVLDAGGRALASGQSVSAPRIWFARTGVVFSAVLPTASVASVPLELAESLALKDAVAALPFYQQALVAFQARPTLGNGLKLVYQANRDSGRSSVSSALASASYGAKSLLARLWQALKSFVLKLLGRAPATAVSQGFSVQPAPGLDSAKAQTVSLDGAHVSVARAEGPVASAWADRLSALAELQVQSGMASAIFSRSAPLDVAEARVLLGLAAAMAGSYGRMTGDGSASSVAASFSRQFDELVRSAGAGPSAPLAADMARLISEPDGGSLRGWMSRVQEKGQAMALALTGAGPANTILSAGSKRMVLADLGAGASAAKGRLSSRGLAAAARLLLAGGSAPSGLFAVLGSQVLGRWGGGGRFGKVYADVSPTEAGGALRILFEDAAGVEKAASALTGMGFAVETRGNALSAALDSAVAQLSSDELAQALARAVSFLQTGVDPGPSRTRLEARREAASGVAKLVSDLKTRRAAAAAVAEALQSSALDLRASTIGRVGALTAQAGRVALADGQTLAFYTLKDPETGLLAFARVESESRVLGADELRALLKTQP